MRKFGVTISEFVKWNFDKQKNYVLGYVYNTRDEGKTQITCKSNLIGYAEVREILSLLNYQYDDLGMAVNIHRSRYYTLLKWLDPFYTSINCDTFKGAYNCVFAANHSSGRIDLFSYNHKSSNKKYENERIRLNIAYDLIHEVRHAYQRLHKEKKYNNNQRNYIQGGESGYSAQWIERDANAFAQRMMNNNKKKINEILGIELNWDCTWGSFSIQRKRGKGAQLHSVDVIKELNAGKKLRQSYWNKKGYIQMSEDGRIMCRGEGWQRPNTPYTSFYLGLYSGGWSVID